MKNGKNLPSKQTRLVLAGMTFYKKESCLQDSPPAAGRFSDMFPRRRSAIYTPFRSALNHRPLDDERPRGAFFFIGRNFL